MITRIIVLTIKGFMNDLISQNQSAFVGGRLIQDNIVVAHEILHSLLKSPKMEKDCLVVKFDMSKAYDRLAKALVVQDGLLLALSCSCREIVVESDSLEVIEVCHGNL